MRKNRAILTIAIVATLFTAAPASARARTDAIVDILRDMLGVDRVVRGHVVKNREATLVLRSDDARTYTINTAALDVDGLRRLRDGRPVAVTLKSPGPGGMPIATAVDLQAGPAKVFRRVDGTVEAVSEDAITLRTNDGMRFTLDPGRIVGEPPQVAVREPITLVYEQEPRVAGVWIESRDVQPAAAPRGER